MRLRDHILENQDHCDKSHEMGGYLGQTAVEGML